MRNSLFVREVHLPSGPYSGMPPTDASVPGLAVERFEIASDQAFRTLFSSLMADAQTAPVPQSGHSTQETIMAQYVLSVHSHYNTTKRGEAAQSGTGTRVDARGRKGVLRPGR
jgi:hypothetical protein